MSWITVSSEVPKPTCCAASSICISSKLLICKRRTSGEALPILCIKADARIHNKQLNIPISCISKLVPFTVLDTVVQVNWPSQPAHRCLCEAWTHYIAPWRTEYINDSSILSQWYVKDDASNSLSLKIVPSSEVLSLLKQWISSIDGCWYAQSTAIVISRIQ